MIKQEKNKQNYLQPDQTFENNILAGIEPSG